MCSFVCASVFFKFLVYLLIKFKATLLCTHCHDFRLESKSSMDTQWDKSCNYHMKSLHVTAFQFYFLSSGKFLFFFLILWTRLEAKMMEELVSNSLTWWFSNCIPGPQASSYHLKACWKHLFPATFSIYRIRNSGVVRRRQQ